MLPVDVSYRIVAGRDLPPMVWHFGYYRTMTAPYEPDMFQPPHVEPVYLLKPSGGWWAFPVLDADDQGTPLTTAWTVLGNRSDWGRRWFAEHGARVQVLVPNPDATVYRVKTRQDLATLAETFPHHYDQSDPLAPVLALSHRHSPKIDWAAMAEAGIDALHVTEPGRTVNRFAEPGEERPVLETWDCETIFWLRPAFTVRPEIIDMIVFPPDIEEQ